MCYAQLMDDILTAIAYGDSKTLQFLLEDYPYWNRHIDRMVFENTAVHMAVAQGSLSIIKLLLTRNFLSNGLDEKGYRPIHIAAMRGCLFTIKQLLNTNVDIEVRDSVETPYVNDRTPLFFAVERGHMSVVQYLLNRGACINAKDSLGRTPLFYAVVWKNAYMTKHLLENGASVHIKGYNYRTPLHEITRSPFTSYEIVTLLTRWGADWEEQDNAGQNAYHYLDNHRQNVCDLFRNQQRALPLIDQFLVNLFADIRHVYQLNDKVPKRIISYFLRVHSDWVLLEKEARKSLNQFIENTIHCVVSRSFRAKISTQFPPELKDLIVVNSLINTMQAYYGIPKADGQLVMDHFFWKFKNNRQSVARSQESEKRYGVTQYYRY